MMKLNRNINKFTVIFLILLFSLNSCGIYKKTDVKTNPINDADKRAKNLAEGKGIQLQILKKIQVCLILHHQTKCGELQLKFLILHPLSAPITVVVY